MVRKCFAAVKTNYSLLGLFVGDDAHIVPFGFCKFWRDDVGIVPYERSIKLARYLES